MHSSPHLLFRWACCLLTSVWAAELSGSVGEPREVEELKLKLLPIPAGTFLMGSPAAEVGRSEDEGPQTRVTLSQPFWLGRTEVTHAQWRKLMGTDLHQQSLRMLADNTQYLLGGQKQTLREYFGAGADVESKQLVYNTDDDAPMYWVSWLEATDFCARLTEREQAAGRLPEGYEYRLPTEAEWEYACRAGTTTATYAGDLVMKGKANAPVLDPIAWYRGNSSEGYAGVGAGTFNWAEKQYPGGFAAQRAVATKQPNAWGLHDMLGNVWECCSNWYEGNLPGDRVTDPVGPANGVMRVARGGGWHRTPSGCRAACRVWIAPGARFNSLGFRVALAPKLPRPSDGPLGKIGGAGRN